MGKFEIFYRIQGKETAIVQTQDEKLAGQTYRASLHAGRLPRVRVNGKELLIHEADKLFCKDAARENMCFALGKGNPKKPVPQEKKRQRKAAYRLWTEEEKRTAAEARADGKTYTEIGEMIGRTSEVVRAHFKNAQKKAGLMAAREVTYENQA